MNMRIAMLLSKLYIEIIAKGVTTKVMTKCAAKTALSARMQLTNLPLIAHHLRIDR